MTQIKQIEEWRDDYLQVIASFETERITLLSTPELYRDSTEADRIVANARALELLRQALTRVENELAKARSTLA